MRKIFSNLLLSSAIVMATAGTAWAAGVSVDDMSDFNEYVITNIYDEPIAKRVFIEPPNLVRKLNSEKNKTRTIEEKLRVQLHASIENPAKYSSILYTPTKDDNYDTIASRFNISIEDLIAANPSSDKEILSLTEPLTIPQVTSNIAGAVTNYATKAFNIVTMGAFVKQQPEMFNSLPMTELLYPLPFVTAVSSKYGWRKWHRFHHGVDLVAPMGTEIHAATGGIVVYAKRAFIYGKLIKVRTYDGHIIYYGHCSKILVKEGDQVAEGSLIGFTGNSGRSTGPHLHFEIRDMAGNTVNPMPLLGIADDRKASATTPPRVFRIQHEIEDSVAGLAPFSLVEE